MNTVTPQDYRDLPALSFAIHQQARRDRTRAISRLSGRVASHVATRIANVLAALRRPSALGAHWG